jgi:hypothetical protein
MTQAKDQQLSKLPILLGYKVKLNPCKKSNKNSKTDSMKFNPKSKKKNSNKNSKAEKVLMMWFIMEFNSEKFQKKFLLNLISIEPNLMITKVIIQKTEKQHHFSTQVT